jgi:uncharacterized BrkB/YihY/UPF0761 family membrane protein
MDSVLMKLGRALPVGFAMSIVTTFFQMACSQPTTSPQHTSTISRRTWGRRRLIDLFSSATMTNVVAAALSCSLVIPLEACSVRNDSDEDQSGG